MTSLNITSIYYRNKPPQKCGNSGISPFQSITKIMRNFAPKNEKGINRLYVYKKLKDAVMHFAVHRHIRMRLSGKIKLKRCN